MLRLWLQFKRWLRSLLVSLALGRPIQLDKKLNELQAILEKVLKLLNTDGNRPSSEPDDSKPKRRRRILWWRR